MILQTPDYAGIVNKVIRPDIYLEAMKEIGVKADVQEMQKVKFQDGSVFDPKESEKYAHSFAVHSMAA